jgi:hypothetical protein
MRLPIWKHGIAAMPHFTIRQCAADKERIGVEVIAVGTYHGWHWQYLHHSKERWWSIICW